MQNVHQSILEYYRNNWYILIPMELKNLISEARACLEAYGAGQSSTYKRDLGPEGKMFAKTAATRRGRRQASIAMHGMDPADGPNIPRRATKGRQYPQGFSPPAFQSIRKIGGKLPDRF